MNKICFGCGSKLQSDYPNKEGYIPKEKIDDSVYCQRCFKITHYGKQITVDTPKTIDEIINNINKNAELVLFLADFITLNKDIIDIFKKIKKNKMLIISKCDIIPKNIRYDLVIDTIKDNYNIDDEIRIISTKNDYGVNKLLNELFYKKLNNVYIVGLSNAGKSTLINKMIDLTDTKTNKITTSKIPNTTLDFLRIKLSWGLTIIDSPGFIIPNLSNHEFKNIIKPKTYQMKKNESILINNVYLKFDNNTSITIYMDNNLNIKKYYKEIDYNYSININNNTDLIIKGEGFINIKNNCLVSIKNLNEDHIELRNSIFGGFYE